MGPLAGAELGQSINKARRLWPVVGVFESGGSSSESEVWADADQLAQAMNRTAHYRWTVRLRDPPTSTACYRRYPTSTRSSNPEAGSAGDIYYEWINGAGPARRLHHQVLHLLVIASSSSPAGATLKMTHGVQPGH